MQVQFRNSSTVIFDALLFWRIVWKSAKFRSTKISHADFRANPLKFPDPKITQYTVLNNIYFVMMYAKVKKCTLYHRNCPVKFVYTSISIQFYLNLNCIFVGKEREREAGQVTTKRRRQKEEVGNPGVSFLIICWWYSPSKLIVFCRLAGGLSFTFILSRNTVEGIKWSLWMLNTENVNLHVFLSSFHSVLV